MSWHPLPSESPTIMAYFWIHNFLLDESGPTAVEYALMLALLLVTVITAINAVGNSTTGVWTNDVNKINGAMSTSS